MDIEKQVINLELAKKLKELGFKQESLFYWCEGDNNGRTGAFVISYGKEDKIHPDWSAYTVAELGEMLPGDKNGDWLVISKVLEKWIVEYQDIIVSFKDNNLANAMAKMLIYLKDNNYLNNPKQ